MFSIFKQFKLLVEKQCDSSIKLLRTDGGDNGGEEERRKATWKGGKTSKISEEGERRFGFLYKRGFFF